MPSRDIHRRPSHTASMARKLTVPSSNPAAPPFRCASRCGIENSATQSAGAGAAEAAQALTRERVDIAFLDIEMPGDSGLELAQSFTPGPVIVFVTAFGRYATEAFDVLAVDYVLKPFSDERFATAV